MPKLTEKWKAANRLFDAGTGRTGKRLACNDNDKCDDEAHGTGMYALSDIDGHDWVGDTGPMCAYNQLMASAILDGAGIEELP